MYTNLYFVQVSSISHFFCAFHASLMIILARVIHIYIMAIIHTNILKICTCGDTKYLNSAKRERRERALNIKRENWFNYRYSDLRETHFGSIIPLNIGPYKEVIATRAEQCTCIFWYQSIFIRLRRIALKTNFTRGITITLIWFWAFLVIPTIPTHPSSSIFPYESRYYTRAFVSFCTLPFRSCGAKVQYLVH